MESTVQGAETFRSILWPHEPQEPSVPSWAPRTLEDLNLDQLFSRVTKGYGDEDLLGLFQAPLHDADVVAYRQEVGRDLENSQVRKVVSNLSHDVLDASASLAAICSALSSSHSYDNNYLSRGRLLDAAERYCHVVKEAADTLSSVGLRSRGLQAFGRYLTDYRASGSFRDLDAWVGRLRDELSKVEYCMLIDGGTVKVRPCEDQESLTDQIVATFARFRRGSPKDYHQEVSEEPYATHVEAAILDLVADFYKDEFADLNAFCRANASFIDPTIGRFAGEVRFFLSWLAFVSPLQDSGLPFCYPTIASEPSGLAVRGLFDVALAAHIGNAVVRNDFVLNGPERMVVITGPNQGGKTTYARAVGQAHWLASLGLNVPGRQATLILGDTILTHFGVREDDTGENGRLQDDLLRLRTLLSLATRHSVLIVNEIFSSTTTDDALLLGRRMMDTLDKMGCVAVVVTFLDELATHGPETVSMMSTVEPDDPATRTFRIERRPPDGLAYAICLARKHRVTYEQIAERIGR